MILRGKMKRQGFFKMFSPDVTFNWTTTSNLGSFNAGTAVSRTLAVTNSAKQPSTFTVVSGTLPGGLSLSSSGALTGTLTNIGGTRTFTVRATYKTYFSERTFSLTTVAGTVSITAPQLTELGPIERFSTFSRQFIATSSLGRPLTFTISAGALPEGLTLTGNTISGTITGAVARYDFTVRASDGLASTISSHSLLVTQPLTKASKANLTSVRYNGSSAGVPTQNIQQQENGFFVTLPHAAHSLLPNDAASSLGFNFNQEVSLQTIFPNGNTSPAGSDAVFYVEYFAGAWFRTATYSQGQWEIIDPRAVSTDWRVRAINVGRYQIGTLTVTV